MNSGCLLLPNAPSEVIHWYRSLQAKLDDASSSLESFVKDTKVVELCIQMCCIYRYWKEHMRDNLTQLFSCYPVAPLISLIFPLLVLNLWVVLGRPNLFTSS